jgi:hypothetical protein
MGLAPTPETAAEIAEMAVPWVLKTYGVQLDYSVFSLKQVDGILDDLRQTEKFDALQPVLFSIGCYVGEVFVRHGDGKWRTTADVGMAAVATSPIVVEMPDGRGCNPVGKVYKRFQNGPEDNIAWFYHVMTEVPAEKLVPKK